MSVNIANIKLYTVEEVARKLGAHPHTVYGYIKEGRLQAKRFGKKYQIPQESLEKYFRVTVMIFLVVFLARPAGSLVFAGARNGAAAPKPAVMAAAIAARLGGLSPSAATRMDTNALLDAIRTAMPSAGDLRPARASGELAVADLALIQALNSGAEFARLKEYLAADAAGQEVITALQPWLAKLGQDAEAREKFAAARQDMQGRLTQLGLLDPAHMAAIFDNASSLSGDAASNVVLAVDERPPQPKPALAPAAKSAHDPGALDFGSGTAAAAPASPAAAYAEALMRLDPDDVRQRQQGRGTVRTWGLKEQEAAAAQGAKLQEPFAKVARRSDNESEIDSALEELRVQIKALDPQNVNFSPGRVRRLFSFLPGLGLPTQRYASNYEKAQEAIQRIITELQDGRAELLEDNERLLQHQSQLRVNMRQLQKRSDLARQIDQELDSRINNAAGELALETRQFLREEVLFPLRQRVIDLQTQLAVAQQGVMATAIIIKNNELLADNVSRTLNVIPPALQVAIDIALGLKTQKTLVNQVNAANQSGSETIANNADTIASQALAIQKQTVEGTISVDTLKNAFGKLKGTLKQLSSFRDKALPQMQEEIKKLEELTRRSEEALAQLETTPPQSGSGLQ